MTELQEAVAVLDAMSTATETSEAASTAPATIPEGTSEKRPEEPAALRSAIEAVESKITTAPEKIPEGSTLIGITLQRDPDVSGRYMTSIDRNWLVPGMAVAIKDGHVVATNRIFGRVTKRVPRVWACHYVTCCNCGERLLQPIAVFKAKDAAEKKGVIIPKETPASKILRQYGRCAKCGATASLAVDAAAEKAELSAFTERVLDAFGKMSAVDRWLPPAAFQVLPQGKTGGQALPSEWQWLERAMAPHHRKVVPFRKDGPGDWLIYNPGFWLGWVQDPATTGLFWDEHGRQEEAAKFNPAGVEGL